MNLTSMAKQVIIWLALANLRVGEFVYRTHGLEWYGEYATLTDEHNDYVKIEYKCNVT